MFLPERKDWMEGEVWEFSVRTNRYHIVFDDDQDVWIDIDDEKIKWDLATQRALSKHKTSSKQLQNEVASSEKKRRRIGGGAGAGDLNLLLLNL